MMDASFDIGPPSDATELAAFAQIASVSLAFSQSASPSDWVDREGHDNVRVVRRGGRLVGGLVSQPMGQWFGGRSVPMAGIRGVAVAPEHRGIGAASALMRSVLVEQRELGMAISALFPATKPVYRRCGFEDAGVRVVYRLKGDAIRAFDRSVTLRPVEQADHETIHRLHAHRARRTTGNLDRSPFIWQRFLEPSPPWRLPVRGYIAEHEGEAEGYVMITQNEGDEAHREIQALDYVAMTPRAAGRIMRFIADHWSVFGTTTWVGAPVDPVLLMMNEQAWRVHDRIDWMLRILDVPAALTARGYSTAVRAELHLDISDDLIDENSSRFVVDVADGRASVRRGGDGLIRCDIRGLATMYTGHLTATQLATTGYVEGSATALSAADAVFAGCSPWMSDMF